MDSSKPLKRKNTDIYDEDSIEKKSKTPSGNAPSCSISNTTLQSKLKSFYEQLSSQEKSSFPGEVSKFVEVLKQKTLMSQNDSLNLKEVNDPQPNSSNESENICNEESKIRSEESVAEPRELEPQECSSASVEMDAFKLMETKETEVRPAPILKEVVRVEETSERETRYSDVRAIEFTENESKAIIDHPEYQIAASEKDLVHQSSASNVPSYSTAPVVADPPMKSPTEINGYSLFFISKRPNRYLKSFVNLKDKEFKEKMKEEWKQLSEEERKAFEDKAEKKNAQDPSSYKFEENPAMECCKLERYYEPGTLKCYGHIRCRIWEGEKYRCGGKNDPIYCEGHYLESTNKEREKVKFEAVHNVKTKVAKVTCKKCRKNWHVTCAMKKPDPNVLQFECPKWPISEPQPPEYQVESLEKTTQSDFMEDYINQWLKIQDNKEELVLVRLISAKKSKATWGDNVNKYFTLRKGVKKPTFSYTSKLIVVSQKINNMDVIFFAMAVQEYDGSKSGNWVNIEWLDSAKYFQPDRLRKTVYQRIVHGYLKWAASVGFSNVHIWASAPELGDDYLFIAHPTEQNFQDQLGLETWYDKLLEAGKPQIVKYYHHGHMKLDYETSTVAKIFENLYFDKGFWKTALDDVMNQLKVIDQLKAIDGSMYKKETNCYDALETSLKKAIEAEAILWKDSHFYIELAEQPQIEDPDKDKEIGTKNMETREKYLGTQIKKNLEFGTLRDAQYATMNIVYELTKKAIPKAQKIPQPVKQATENLRSSRRNKSENN